MNKNKIYIYYIDNIQINNINLSLQKKSCFSYSNILEEQNRRIRIEIFQIKLYPVSHVKIDTDRNIEE